MIAKLQSIPIMAGLDEAALGLLWEHAQQSKPAPGSVIVREGENGNRLYIVAAGSVRVCKHFGEPNEIELTRLGPGSFFGEMCILETLPRSATVLADVDTTVYTLSALTLYQLYQKMPAQYGVLVLNIARDLSRRLRHLDEVIAAQR